METLTLILMLSFLTPGWEIHHVPIPILGGNLCGNFLGTLVHLTRVPYTLDRLATLIHSWTKKQV